MSSLDEFQFWVGEFLENPRSLDSETRRIFADMYARGNPHAIAYFDQEQRNRRRRAVERGELVDPNRPINTIGSFDAKEVDYSYVAPDLEANYSKDWPDIAAARKQAKHWRCEECSFQSIHSGLIQVHHIDRDKSNNARLNLQVLCAICHGEKHWSAPLWPTGVLEAEKSKLVAYHLSHLRRTNARR